MRKKLTSKTVDALPPPEGKRYEVWDQTLSGFGIRVSVSGRKTWFCTSRVNRKLRRHTLGTYPALSLSDARRTAQKVMREVQLGTYDETETPTLGETIPKFIELYAKPKNRHWRQQERLLNQKFALLFDKPLDGITRSNVVRILDDMTARGRANHVLAAIKKLMNWALDRGMIDVNPIAGLKPPSKIKARDRILSDVEIIRFMTAADAEGYPFGPLYQLLLLTGQRRGEVSAMSWSEIDFERRMWTIPAERSKNGLAHEVPLSDAVIDILISIPRFQGSDYVFTTTGLTPISGFGRAKLRIEEAVGSDDWWVHDLRRTAASGMARLGVAPHVVEKVLNHKSGIISGVAAVYNRYGYEDEKREALDLWAQRIVDLMTKNGANQPSIDHQFDETDIKRTLALAT